jgi:type IV secretory pathway protease TraF
MEKLTRRKLITTVSVGAGMAGILAATAACAPSDTMPASASEPLGKVSGPSGKAPKDPLAVFVTDPERGTLVIMNGDREITITHPDLAQSLLSLT